MNHFDKKRVVAAVSVLAVIGWWSAGDSEQALAQPQFPAQPPAIAGTSAPGDVVTVMASRVGNVVTLGGTVITNKEVTLTAQIPSEV